MADGILCKNCGWQETEHMDTSRVTDKMAQKRIRGYKMTLASCMRTKEGYTPEDQELAEELSVAARKREMRGLNSFGA